MDFLFKILKVLKLFYKIIRQHKSNSMYISRAFQASLVFKKICLFHDFKEMTRDSQLPNIKYIYPLHKNYFLELLLLQMSLSSIFSVKEMLMHSLKHLKQTIMFTLRAEKRKKNTSFKENFFF